MTAPRTEAQAPGPWHEALIWPDGADKAGDVLPFIQDGVRRREAVSVGVSAPLGRRLRDLAAGLPHVDFFDMTELGRNPSRIISAMLDFARTHAGRPLRYISEPVWAGRSAAEDDEAARHESLVNLAFANVAATVICLYDTRGLDGRAISCAEQTHPVLIAHGREQASPRYAGRGVLPVECEHALAGPPEGAARLSYQDDLRPVRALVTTCAADEGLVSSRTADLVLAVSEVAANTLRHTRGAGLLQVWPTATEIICQVTDSGYISDPLAGRRRPPSDTSGQGLWVVHQVCDLVELRSGPGGTTIRMHIRQ
jgi:anti-sigma regulatory factor (Ser/Thr protein kinase)